MRILYFQKGVLGIKLMSKKVEFLIIVFAFVIFFTQAFFILETKKNNDINLSFLNLVKASNSNDFNGLDFCILELNCTYKLPKEFIFYKDGDRIYYKFKKNNQDYIISSECECFKNIFFAFLFFAFLFFIFFSLLYLLYKNNIKNLKYQKDTINTFFNDAMHELKTPLGVAILNVSMLDESVQKSRLKAALNQMKITYEDVEYFIKNPYSSYENEKINFSLILKQRLAQFHTILELKNIKSDIKIDDDLYIFLNKIQANRIIDNNLSNAIKYTKNQLKIRLFKRFDKIYFLIYDNGLGIKDTKKIFNRYVRQNQNQGGFGIGLNIVKNICLKNEINFKAKNIKNGALFIYEFKEYKKLILDKE